MNERLEAYRLLIADVFELAGRSRETSEQIARSLGQTAARWHVMSVVSEDALNVPTIARRLGLTRQSVQRIVNDLTDAGLVSLQPNPDHERSSLVALTEQGKHVMEELFRQSEASRTALLDRTGLSPDDLHDARRVVRQLLAAFDEEGGDDPAR
ncbi:MarR family transcriptional regulator [Actinobacteria bacterium YIM 96077]|uniref:MarR family transcriptional regulator n=1 Tax=Phytoactinopolyspora halophila TaxID=1981511 RepID=A0A329QZR8_9ACTN|nr:MarR family transcriptional regulator [Phytoactinopolyspora halophila]AYY13136.1 MarR family transcriptional regulator [Actinobacteria bacterium YIM 96077]RAW17623.1 MarR family transcriptional regulator [Phytoactinopolyspora halophila]